MRDHTLQSPLGRHHPRNAGVVAGVEVDAGALGQWAQVLEQVQGLVPAAGSRAGSLGRRPRPVVGRQRRPEWSALIPSLPLSVGFRPETSPPRGALGQASVDGELR
jgi:hypothetical protein